MTDTQLLIGIMQNDDRAFDWMEIPVTEELNPGKVIEVTVPAFDAKVISLV